MNRKLRPSQLDSFRNHRNKLVWTGNIEDASLFELWRNIVDEVEGPPEFHVINSPLIVQIDDSIATIGEDASLIDNEGNLVQPQLM